MKKNKSNPELSVSLPEICTPRDELMRRFDQCAKKQYIIVQASAGYGKTVSALLWLKRVKFSFTLLSLDEYDNKPPVFYRSLCQRLLTFVPNNKNLEQIVNNPSFSASPVESAIEFLSSFIWPDAECSLVLDDFHAITNEQIIKSLPFVLKRLSQAVHVIILSRTALPEAMSLIADRAAFIDGPHLAFTPKEIRNLYAGYGQTITAKEAEDIHSYTDGWVIILNAMAQSANLQSLTPNKKPSLENFFEKNIWNGLDEKKQVFLLKTSIVDSFTPELCERLTGDDYEKETLEALMAENIPLSRLGTEYRYHNLFLEFLRQFMKKSGIAQAELCHRAALYYLETGQFYRASVYSVRSDNADIKLRVIQTFFQLKNPPLEQFLELSSVYNDYSKEASDKSPILYMPKILSAFLTGKVDAVKQLFDMFYPVLPVLLNSNHPLTDTIAIRLLLDFRRSLAEFPALIDSLHLKKDVKLHGQVAIVTMQMPFAHRSIRDFSEFLDADIREPMLRMFSPMFPENYELFYQGINSGLLIEQNRIGEAFPTMLAAYNTITDDTNNEIIFSASVSLAELYLLKGETKDYLAALSSLRDFIYKNKALYLLQNLSAYEARTNLWEGNKKTAEEWLANYFVSDNAFGEFYKIYQNFTTVRTYIVMSEVSKAMTALEQLKNLAQSMNRPLDTAEADILYAIVEWITGKKKEACTRLYSVLIDLQPYGFIRIVANEGKAVLPILKAVIKKMDKEANKDKILYRFIKEVHVATYEQSRRFKGLTHGLNLNAVKLSPKQTHVLELLSKGHSNSEIVEMTGLSLNTIKTHTKLAYQKLNVTNVSDAIIEAKHLGIIR